VKANLDKWIKDAKDDVPDSGEYRRLNRALLKERMHTTGTGRRRLHGVLLVSIILVVLVFFSGSLNQLGSDDFKTVRDDYVNLQGNAVPVLKNEFRGNSFIIPKDFTPADLDEMNRAIAAGEGEIIAVYGTSYGGKTNWIKYVKQIINGKVNKMGQDLADRPDVTLDNYMKFLEVHMQDIVEKTRTSPHQREALMTFDDVLCNMKIWVFHFPEYGEVLRYQGVPVEGP
jgi:hypothetical protein